MSVKIQKSIYLFSKNIFYNNKKSQSYIIIIIIK